MPRNVSNTQDHTNTSKHQIYSNGTHSTRSINLAPEIVTYRPSIQFNPSTPPDHSNGSLSLPPLPPQHLQHDPRLTVSLIPKKAPLPPLRAPIHPNNGGGLLLPNPRNRCPVRETRSPSAENDARRGTGGRREEAEGRYEGGVLSTGGEGFGRLGAEEGGEVERGAGWGA